MTTCLCVLDLSDPDQPLHPVLEGLRGLTPLRVLDPIRSPHEITDRPDPLILYIVGHAAPDMLLDPGEAAGALRERKVARAIEKARDGKPTMIVWDVCFAGSFLEFSPFDRWGKEYVHVFGCQAHERTWHTGDPLRQTMFSIQLGRAIETLRMSGAWSLDALQTQLRKQFGNVQTPEVRTKGLELHHFLHRAAHHHGSAAHATH